MFPKANIHGLLKVIFDRCPKEVQLAAFVDRTLEARQQQRIERHLAICDECCDQIGTLVKSQRLDIEIEHALLTRAVRLATSTQVTSTPTRPWALAAVGGLAASLVATGAVLYWLNFSPSPPSARTIPSWPARAVQVATAESAATPLGERRAADMLRGRKPGMRVVVISPRAGSQLNTKTPIQWRRIRQAVSYDVRVLAVNGDVLWMDQLEADNANIPDTVQLIPGKHYFVMVRAYLIDGKTIDSTAIEFRFVPRT